MAAQQIPYGSQGLPVWICGSGNAARWPGVFGWKTLSAAERPAKPGYLRRDGAVGVQFPADNLASARSWSMSPAAQRHIPVLGRQAIELLSPRAGGIYVDATFGAGGYSAAILDAPGTRIIGIDRDRSAILGGVELVDRSDGRLTLVE